MINENMTYTEIRNELIKDRMEVIRFATTKIMAYQKMRRSKKYNLKNAHRLFEFRSKRNNRYVYKLDINGKKEEDMSSYLFCEYNLGNESNTVIMYPDGDYYEFYLNGFMNIYKNRLNLNFTTNAEIVSHYLSINPRCAPEAIDIISENEMLYKVVGVVDTGILNGILNVKEGFATYDNFSTIIEMTEEEFFIFNRIKMDSYSSKEKSLV